MKLSSKKRFIGAYQAGRLGNRAPTWNTLTEFLASGYRGKVHLRNRIAGGPTQYNVPATLVELFLQDFLDVHKLSISDIYVSGMAPHDKNVLQGEVRRSERGLDLIYSTQPGLPMRDALREYTKQATGLGALCLLRAAMDANSFDWLQILFDEYPDHVVEFSSFSIPWGTLNWNTCFWELRADREVGSNLSPFTEVY